MSAAVLSRRLRRQAQQALQLFYLKCGFYPGRYENNNCLGGTLADSANNPADWSDLRQILKDARIGVDEIPNDPGAANSYQYYVQLAGPSGTPKAQCYVLTADLETDHRAFKGDLDMLDLEQKLAPFSASDLATNNIYPLTPAIDCADTGRHYCLGNVECFHGGP